MQFFTTGIETVDKMGQLNISGNIKPAIWNKTIVDKKGKPQRLAMDILADVVYWYKPTEVRDEASGQVKGWKKKFKADLLQRGYGELIEQFGENKKTISRALIFLEELGVLKRVFRTIKNNNGMITPNVMFLELNYERLYELTFPDKKNMAETTEGNNLIGDEYEILSEEYAQDIGENAEKTQDLSMWTNLTTPMDKYDHMYGHNYSHIRTNVSVPMDKDDRTNTYITTEDSTEISSSISNLIDCESENRSDLSIDDVTEYVKGMISYDRLYKELDGVPEKESCKRIEYNNILDDILKVLVYEVYLAPDTKIFNFGSKEAPDNKSNHIIKNVFNKNLSYSKIIAYINQYLENSNEVRNATLYHIKSLYRQCLTQSSQSMSGGRNFHV